MRRLNKLSQSASCPELKQQTFVPSRRDVGAVWVLCVTRPDLQEIRDVLHFWKIMHAHLPPLTWKKGFQSM